MSIITSFPYLLYSKAPQHHSSHLQQAHQLTPTPKTTFGNSPNHLKTHQVPFLRVTDPRDNNGNKALNIIGFYGEPPNAEVLSPEPERQVNPFAETVKPLSPLSLNTPIEFFAHRGSPSHNIKTNLTLIRGSLRDEVMEIIASKARFTLINPNSGKKLENIPFKWGFSEAESEKPFAYLGSADTKHRNRWFVEFAIKGSPNSESTLSASEALGLEYGKSQKLMIKRIQ